MTRRCCPVELAWEILLTAVCALGLAFAAWWMFGRLLRPIPRQRVWAVVSGRGDGSDLEQSVRAFIWLRSLGLLRCPVVIADVDLTARGWEVALRLTARWPDVALWPADHLRECVDRE